MCGVQVQRVQRDVTSLLVGRLDGAGPRVLHGPSVGVAVRQRLQAQARAAVHGHRLGDTPPLRGRGSQPEMCRVSTESMMGKNTRIEKSVQVGGWEVRKSSTDRKYGRKDLEVWKKG